MLNEYQRGADRRRDYDAFGNAITEIETVKNPYRYAGYYQDSESGLYYLRSRYYNPKTARFLTEDTASGKYNDPLSLNKYTYCHNQPVTQDDPTGHWAHIVAGAVIGGVMGAISAKKANPSANWKTVARAALGGAAEGAIIGGVGAATGGASLAYAVGAGAVAGAVGNTANQLISTGKVDGKKVLASSAACAVGAGVAKYAGGLLNPTGSEAAAKATVETVSNAGKQAAANAGGNVISKTIKAAAQGGIIGSAVGASADLTMQCAEYGAGYRDGIDGKELAASALFGGGLGAGLGAASGATSQTKLGNKIATSYQEGTDNLNKKIASFEKAVDGRAKRISTIRVDSYYNMRNDKTVTGQAHHLSQNAAFKDVIPSKEGLCIELEGNALTDIGTEHYEVHKNMEEFWAQYRKGGSSYGKRPTISQYNEALYDSLRSANVSRRNASYAVKRALSQQAEYGLSESDLVPRIPGKTNQRR